MTAPKAGDRVRVVLEGEVEYYFADGFVVGSNGINPDDAHVVSVEVLLPPEPEWQDGDVVRTPGGRVYVRNDGAWMFGHDRYTHEAPLRPLTRLVPEEQS